MTNAELEKARVRLYEKSDRKPAIMATGGALMALFGFIAFLNLIGSVNLALRPGQQPIERFLFWLVLRSWDSSVPTASSWPRSNARSSRSSDDSQTSFATSRRRGVSA